ncbi:MAG: alpha/beta hydrolase fold domain-containing protein [Methyloprofundus sp.]|nr:alpha/beta hydrolase fold domain-containing protein [Methyloprofundus sp.]
MRLKIFSYLFMALCTHQLYAVQVTRDITYTHTGQKMDLLLPERTELDPPRAAAIVMHSGGWVSGERSEMAFIAQWFAEQGLVVINVDYTLATSAEKKWPAQLADVIQGVWWLKENATEYHINPDKILAVGASAGGYLAAMLGQTSVSNFQSGVDSEVHGLVCYSAPWDLLNANSAEQRYYTSLLLSSSTAEALYLASPLYQITRHSPPVLIFHGTEDVLVPFQQSDAACHAYLSKGLESCSLQPLAGCTHFLERSDIEASFDSIRLFLNSWLATEEH